MTFSSFSDIMLLALNSPRRKLLDHGVLLRLCRLKCMLWTGEGLRMEAERIVGKFFLEPSYNGQNGSSSRKNEEKRPTEKVAGEIGAEAEEAGRE